MVMTLLVFHEERSALKFVAPLNIPYMLVTRLVSHLPISASHKLVLPEKRNPRLVREGSRTQLEQADEVHALFNSSVVVGI